MYFAVAIKIDIRRPSLGSRRSIHLRYSREVSSLPAVLCATCLVHMRLPLTACEDASRSRRLLESYIAEQGWDVQEMDADGWCMAACVGHAVGMSKKDALRAALNALKGIDLPQFAEEDRVRIREECDTLLAKPANMGKRWDSSLFDILPLGFAEAVGRPLMILEVMDGAIKCQFVQPTSKQGPRGGCIRLLLSCKEMRQNHYDLVA